MFVFFYTAVHPNCVKWYTKEVNHQAVTHCALLHVEATDLTCCGAVLHVNTAGLFLTVTVGSVEYSAAESHTDKHTHGPGCLSLGIMEGDL